MNAAYTQEELAHDIKLGCKEAFSYLYANYSAALLMIINSITNDRHVAEDILQDTFVNIWINIHQYNPEKGSLYTWMRNIAKNRALDYFKCSVSIMRSKTHIEECSLEIHAPLTEQTTEHIGIARRLLALSPALSSLVHQIYYIGYTMEEVSKISQIPIGTIKTRMRRALQLLRNDFEYSV